MHKLGAALVQLAQPALSVQIVTHSTIKRRLLFTFMCCFQFAVNRPRTFFRHRHIFDAFTPKAPTTTPTTTAPTSSTPTTTPPTTTPTTTTPAMILRFAASCSSSNLYPCSNCSLQWKTRTKKKEHGYD